MDFPETASAGPTDQKPPRPRRWIPLSLRMFLAILLGLSSITVWFAVKGYVQHQIVRRIVAAGGHVEYGGQYHLNGRLKLRGTPRGPAWLRGVIGDDFLDSPTSVAFYGRNRSVRGEDIIPDIVQLPSLKAISINGIRLTQQDLDRLSVLKGVHTLHFSEGSLDDLDLEALKRLKLTWLGLPRSRISDKGMRSLKDIRSLRYLDLTRSRVSDRSIEYLAELSNLRTLIVCRTKISREGVALLESRLPDCHIEWEMPTNERDTSRQQDRVNIRRPSRPIDGY